MMQGEVQLQPFDSQKLGDSAPLIENSPSSSSSSAAAGSSNEINAVDLESGSASAPCCRICLENDSDLLGDELISPCMCKGTHQFVHRSCLDHWRSVKEGFAFSHCTTCKAQFHLRVEPFEDSNSWRRKAKFRLFVARDVLLVFFAVQTVIAVMAGCAYMMDKDGEFRNSFNHDWDRILSKHPISFYYCIGVVTFFVLIGFIGLILHCSSLNGNDPRMAGSDPRMAGSDPRMAGSDPRMAESDPKMAESDPKMAGSDPRMAGSDPRMAGSDPRMAGSQNCSYGSHNLGYFPASEELCVALVVVFVVIFAILGLAYGFLAATMAIQRIWQRHYHILTKRGLTKEYIVEDLHGCYTPPKLDAEHEGILKMLKLM